ncbi:hypothetical protein ZWY2020_030298 [Hordeum vulgare]|nr:hypothetical protein ZWY2020_030298 [Hordeum vulgare]
MESVEGNGTGRGNLQLVVSELCRIQELVRQLELHLHAPDTSVDLCRALTAQIFALTDRSIGFVAAAHSSDAPTTPSSTSSSLSGVSDQPFRTNTKKRKATARWTSQVRVSAAGGAEGPGDDGHSWRKYGQKDILGAKHPRAYYRCTHRNSQGCTATKQVQRADEDPVLFDVVYHGQHTCRPTGGGGGGRRPPTNQHNPHAESLLQSLRAGLAVDADHGGLNTSVCVSPPMTSPSMASPVASGSNGGPTMSPYPAGAYTEWPLDGDLQEVVSVFTAVSAPSMDYLFEFDPTFDVDAPNFFM